MTLEGCATSSAPPDTSAASVPTTTQSPPVLNSPMQKPLTADKSSPNKVGWIQDLPPPPNRIIRFDLADNVFPHTRYGYNHMRGFVPTRVVWRGDGPVSKLSRAEYDISGVLFTDPNGTRHTFAEAFKLTYIDGILVMYKGKVIHEHYLDALDAHVQYIAMSIMKSLVDTLATMLMADGRFNSVASMTQYVPELEDTAYGDAIVRQMMDMTAGTHCSEGYVNPNTDIRVYARTGGMLPRPAGYKGPDNSYDYLTMLHKEGEYDAEFAYKTVNTETLVWIMRCASNKSLVALLSERIWWPMGTQDGTYFSVDSIGMESGGGGLNATPRDLARFGEMTHNDGRFSGKQILPKSVTDDIRRGDDPTKFVEIGYMTLPGYPYRDIWWVSSSDHHISEACGVHGQHIYIDSVV